MALKIGLGALIILNVLAVTQGRESAALIIGGYYGGSPSRLLNNVELYGCIGAEEYTVEVKK